MTNRYLVVVDDDDANDDGDDNDVDADIKKTNDVNNDTYDFIINKKKTYAFISV